MHMYTGHTVISAKSIKRQKVDNGSVDAALDTWYACCNLPFPLLYYKIGGEVQYGARNGNKRLQLERRVLDNSSLWYTKL